MNDSARDRQCNMDSPFSSEDWRLNTSKSWTQRLVLIKLDLASSITLTKEEVAVIFYSRDINC